MDSIGRERPKAKRRRHKYEGIIPLIDTERDTEDECYNFRSGIRHLLRGFEDTEADFDMLSDWYVAKHFFPDKPELCNALDTVTHVARYNSIVYFEVLCILRPLVEPYSTLLRDIVYVKHAGLVACSWYESLDFHFDRNFRDAIKSLPNYTHADLRNLLRRAFRSRERFRKAYKCVRNSVVAHRRTSVYDYEENDSSVLDDRFLSCMADFLFLLSMLKAHLLLLICTCFHAISETSSTPIPRACNRRRGTLQLNLDWRDGASQRRQPGKHRKAQK